MYCCSCAEKKSGYGLGKHKRNCQNEKKWGEKYIGSYTKHEGILFMIWAAIWGGGCTGESTEWTGIRDRPKEGILHAPIWKLLNILYLLYGV